MPTYAEAVSTLALAIGAANTAWQVRRGQLDRPHVIVTWHVQQLIHMKKPDEDELRYIITVTNVGQRPVTITSVGWVSEQKGFLYEAVGVARDWPVDHGDEDESEEIQRVPFRLDALDAATWTATRKFIYSQIGNGDRLKAFVRFVGQPPLLRLPRTEASRLTEAWSDTWLGLPEDQDSDHT
jgi:hypothetical protein